MLNVYITGASGYLGSTFLLNAPENWNITCYGRHVPDIPLPHNINWLKGDLSRTKDSVVIPEGIDLLIHLGALKGSGPCSVNSAEAIKINILGTSRLLEAAKNIGVKKFIFSSSYWVYGSTVNTLCEETTPIAPSEMYGLTKAISELEVMSSGINYLILRFTNIFGWGSGIQSEEVVHYFIRAALKGMPIQVEHGGTQTVDLLDVTDACSILRILSESPTISNEIINVGSGNPRSVGSVALMIREIFLKKFNKNIQIITEPYDNIGMEWRGVSVNKLRQTIPEFTFRSFEESIEQYIKELGGLL
jgi:UDP-glucose 4-epimerase